MTLRLLLRLLIIPAILVLNGFSAMAQNVSFVADAAAATVGKNNQFQVVYTIRDVEDLRTLAPGKNDDFTIVDGPYHRTSSSISIVNGRTVQSIAVSATFVYQPNKTGNLTIPPATAIDAQGRTYHSNPLNIKVIPGTIQAKQQQQEEDPFDNDPFAAFVRQQQQQMNRWQQQQRQAMQQQQQAMRQAPQAAPVSEKSEDINKNLFIKVSVDKSNVHIGEQVTAYYKLYARMPMQMAISKLPLLNGFWTQDFELPKQPTPTEEIIDGKKYQVFVLKKSALFPQQTGKLILDPAEAEGMARIVQQVRQRSPFADFFDDPFFRQMMGGSMSMSDPFFNDDAFSTVSYKDVPVHIKSQPVTINVSPLPDSGKYSDFGGAVGNFTVNAKIDKEKLTTDETAIISLSIDGSGNLKLIQTPVLQLPNGLTSYEPQILDTITGRTTTISGSKKITYTISPTTPGSYTIPPISFTYYDTHAGEYKTLKTQAFKLNVTAGANYSPSIAKNNLALKDIHNNVIKAPETFSFLASKPLIFSPFYWSMYGLSALAFLGLIVWKKKENELSGNVSLLKNKKANKVALKRMTNAKNLLVKNATAPFYEEVSKAIWLYVSDKLSIPLSTLNKETATTALTEKQVPTTVLDSINRVVNDCELALYAPMGGQKHMQQTYEEAIDIISKLENHL